MNGANETVYQQSHYRSTLTVTGNLPGLYQYSATNRATTTAVTSSYSIEGVELAFILTKKFIFYCIGAQPTNLMAEVIGLGAVLVSWTAPPAPPSGGYLITTDPGGVRVNASLSPYTITNIPPGVYSIQVTSLSQHLPGGMTELQGFIVRGEWGYSNYNNNNNFL